MADPRDADGDSQMDDNSSPSDSDDAMFPASNTDIDQTSDKPSPGAGAMLSSPPGSQSQVLPSDGVTDIVGETDLAKTLFKQEGEEPFTPGASWKNKKARDEAERAWAVLEDKSFSLKEFGDPFDDTLTEPVQPKK